MISATKEQIKSGNLPEIETNNKLTKEQAQTVAMLIYDILERQMGGKHGKD